MSKPPPEDADALIALGHEREDAGEFEAALVFYEQALRARPAYSRAHMNIGNALRRLGRLDEAIASLREAVLCAPELAPPRFNLGAALASSRDYPRAERELREALGREPGMAEAMVLLADVFESTGRIQEAEAELQAALRARPGYSGAALNLGLLYLHQNRFEAAERALVEASAMSGGSPSVEAALGTLYLKTGRIAEAIHAARNALDQDPTMHDARSGLLFALNLSNELEPLAVFEEHARQGTELARAAGSPFSHWTNEPDPARRLRVGYVSGDFGRHPIGLFLRPVLQRHDSSRFEVYCYSNRKAADEITQALQQMTQHWCVIAGEDDELVAKQIRRDEIDILVDLAGHTADNRLSLFARRPAPVQVTWLGYLNTTGLPTMDYRICDRYTDPAGAADRLSTEKLYRMPHSQWCYSPVYDIAPIQTPHIHEPEAMVFGSFNQYAKISDSCLDLWCRILARLPHAMLTILDVPDGRTQNHLRDRLAKRQIDPASVTIHGRMSIVDYFAAIVDVDIALDTFPYNGATTTLDTLWMGVPLVALPGDRGIARSSYSILQSAGLHELIASTPDDYVELNVRLARDESWRQTLRDTLRGRLEQSPVMDTAQFVRDLETAYRRMWSTWCNSRVPVH